jgi:tyrosine-protein kinase
MQSSLSHFVVLVKRWVWLVALGIVICGGTTYAVSKLLLQPVYQATTTLIINTTTSTSAYDNFQTSELAVPTYAQLIKNSEVLGPVITQNPGLTLGQLNGMVSVIPQSNTTLIQLNVENVSPELAAELANEIGRSFTQYLSAQFSVSVSALPAEIPINPIRPKPLEYAGIAALVGLGLAIALIIVFEWLDDRLARPEEVQEILSMETLGVIPKLSPRRVKRINVSVDPRITEANSLLCANLNAAQKVKPFKLMMVTSSLADEGRSTVAANLAISLASAGLHVLLVDADLRKPSLDQHFRLKNQEGLSNALQETMEDSPMEINSQGTYLPTLHVLTAGVLPHNPSELLLSEAAKKLFDYFRKAPFDYIIFDSSPLLPVADAQILASYVQAMVLVVDPSKAPRNVLQRTGRLLQKMHAMPLGVIINKSYWPDNIYDRRLLSERRRPVKTVSMPEPTVTPAVYDLEEISTMRLQAVSADGFGDNHHATEVLLPRQQKSIDDKN